jgi:hypothetical protein
MPAPAAPHCTRRSRRMPRRKRRRGPGTCAGAHAPAAAPQRRRRAQRAPRLSASLHRRRRWASPSPMRCITARRWRRRLRERTLRVPTSRQATIHEVAWRTWAPHLEVAPPGLLYVFAPLPHVSFSHSGRRGSLSVLMPEAGDGSQGLAKKPTPVRHDVHSNERGRTHFVVVPLVQDPWRSGRRTSTWRECSGAHA